MEYEAIERNLTPFVREVVLPGADSVPCLRAERCKYALTSGSSSIHRWGIFAAETIPSRRRVIEYTGELISAAEVWRRRFRKHLYIFWLDQETALDGAFGGSGAEFINHSCDPNLRADIRRGRIFLTSVRQIAKGEELTLNYELGEDGLDTPCSCGSIKCKGFIL
jgi:SET domain-containing protein